MSNSKDMKQLLTELEVQGFVLEQRSRRSSRLKVVAPDGEVTFMGTSVGDARSIRNARSWASSHGFQVETEKKGRKMASTAATRSTSKTAAAAAREMASASRQAPRSVFDDPAADPVEVEEPVVEDVVVPEPATRPAVKTPAAPMGRKRLMTTTKSTRAVPSTPAADVPRAVVETQEGAPAEFNGLPRAHPAWPVGTVAPMGDGVWIEIAREVTPELAATFLDYNTWNRNAPGRTVGGYARDMSGGSFYDKQGDPIRFAGTGQLLDGQQRLMSMVESGATLQFNVITGLPTSAQETMDSGRRRTAADQLKLAQVSSAEVVGSAAKILWEMDNGAFMSRVPAATSAEIIATVMECQEFDVDLEMAAAAVAPARKVVRMQSVAAAIYFLQAQLSVEDTERFWEMLSSGLIPEEDMSVLALRETLRNRIANKTLRRQQDAAYLIIRAWNTWRRGIQQKTFMLPKSGITSENFPTLI